jgi:FAD/FMN-containing dehydrogenase
MTRIIGRVSHSVPETNSDLFHAIPMSYGTLGFLTSITIKMIPYKPFIRITYRPTYSLDGFVKVGRIYYFLYLRWGSTLETMAFR